MADQITARSLIDAGLSRSFAHFVIKGDRKLGVSTALWLLDEHGLKAGPLAGKSAREIETLRDVYPAEAPASVRKRVAARQ